MGKWARCPGEDGGRSFAFVGNGAWCFAQASQSAESVTSSEGLRLTLCGYGNVRKGQNPHRLMNQIPKGGPPMIVLSR
jgi:hypothetical protein